MALDRSTGATIARSGGRLVVALLPLAALALVRVLPSLAPDDTPVWMAPTVAGGAAAVVGVALLVAVAAGLRHGRLRDLADAAALGILTATLAVIALGSSGAFGIGLGSAAAAVAFILGTAATNRWLQTRRSRVTWLVVAFVAVEACLAIVVLASGASGGAFPQVLLAGAGAVLVIAAVASLDEMPRATGIAIAASSTLVMALSGSAAGEQLIGFAGLAVAGATLGSWLVVDRLIPDRAVPDANLVDDPLGLLDEIPAPDYSESARLARELRATIDDLIAARHTIQLQRDEIERAATVDQLTGVASRATLLERLRIEAAEGRRYAHPVAVVLLDVDRFGELNHYHGPGIGDTVLREVALRLRLRIREADALGRVGADAFAAILPHTDEAGAAAFARAVLDRLAERRFAAERGELAVSASVGIALLRPGIPMSDEELLAAAEDALASARAAGGDRIAFDRDHSLPRIDQPPSEPTTGAAADRSNEA